MDQKNGKNMSKMFPLGVKLYRIENDWKAIEENSKCLSKFQHQKTDTQTKR
jgi:hypothetical protein